MPQFVSEERKRAVDVNMKYVRFFVVRRIYNLKSYSRFPIVVLSPTGLIAIRRLILFLNTIADK